MSDNNVVKSNKIAGWMDDFINTFANKKSNKEEMTADVVENEKIAEINLNDLPKVIWNDETYHVLIDDDGATVVNGFGNTVTTLPGLKTLDEVNNELNGKQIVSENINNSLEIDAEMEKEIEKALAYKDSIITADDISGEQATEDYINSDPNANSNQNINSNNIDNNNQNTQQTARVAEYMVGETLKQIEPFDYTSKMTELMDKKLNDFENKISEILNNKFDQILNEKLNELTKQFYSVTNDQIEDNVIIDKREIVTDPINIDEVNDNINDNIIDNIIEDNIIEENSINNEEELPSDEIEKFKEGICPFCDSELVKEDIDDNFAHIGCGNCDVKYKVDLNNEKIYIE